MFKPLNKNILVKAINDNQTNNSIFMGKSETPTYEVISIGKSVSFVKTKDIVYLNESKLVQLNIGNEIYYIVHEDDIYMVVEK